MLRLKRVECAQFSKIPLEGCVLGPGGGDIVVRADTIVRKIEQIRAFHQVGGLRPRYTDEDPIVKPNSGPKYSKTAK